MGDLTIDQLDRPQQQVASNSNGPSDSKSNDDSELGKGMMQLDLPLGKSIRIYPDGMLKWTLLTFGMGSFLTPTVRVAAVRGTLVTGVAPVLYVIQLFITFVLNLHVYFPQI